MKNIKKLSALQISKLNLLMGVLGGNRDYLTTLRILLLKWHLHSLTPLNHKILFIHIIKPSKLKF